MKRIDGFIDLDNLLKLEIPALPTFERYEELIERMKSVPNFKVVKSERFYHYDNPLFVLCFDINNKTYFFKQDLATIPYYELIAEELANDLNLECVHYDLAKLGKYKGIISENYKKENAKYMSGGELLKAFYEKDKYSNSNNLMDIWHVLETRYQSREDMQKIVEKLMNKLVKLLIFDMITGQNDRHNENWGIVEYQNGEVDLQPIFDNSRMLLKDPYNHKLELFSDEDNYYLESSLEYLHEVSDFEVNNFLLAAIGAISEQNIDRIIKRVEARIECEIPETIKHDIKCNFREQFDYMLRTINNSKLRK